MMQHTCWLTNWSISCSDTMRCMHPIPPGTLQSQPLDLVKKLKPCILPSSLPSSRRWLLFEVADEGTIFSVRVITGAWGFGWAKGDTLELGAVNDGVEPPAFIAA